MARSGAGIRAGDLQPELPETEIDDTPDPDAVMRALWEKAAKGDATAAKELRAWLDRDGEKDRGTDIWKELTRKERDDLLDALGVERAGHPPER